MINAIEKYNQHKLNIGLVNAFVSTLPSSNLKDGDIYILNSNNSVNIYYNSSWRSITATTGMLCVLKTDSNIYVFSNGSWERKSTDISQTYLDTELAKKVDKIDGYSLVSDNDILNWNSKADGEHTHIMEDITNFPTIPTVTNDLTNELKNNYDNAYANTHTHSNKSKIDKIGEDVNGNLTYNGNTIVANSTWDNISDKPFETLDNNTLKVTDGILSVIGGGGTTNYSDLENKPSINSVELTGNKTLADLGIQPSGDYLTEIPSEYVTDTELESKGYANTSQIPDVSNKLEVSNILQGTNIILNKVGNDITINSEGGSGGSVVTDSEINGNIVIDGSETNVYTLPSDVAKTSDLHSHNNKTALDEITTVKVTQWNTVVDKIDKVEGMGLSTNDYTTDDKDKLDGIDFGANKYIHPNDVNTRHVTDTEKEFWNGKSDFSGDYNDLLNLPSVLGDMTSDVYDPQGRAIDIFDYVDSKAGSSTAEDTSYDNALSGLNATNVQEAIDENNSQLAQKAKQTDIGNILDLNTADKTSVVNAINEIASNSNSESNTTPSIIYFDAHNNYRAWQGVAADSQYIYVLTDRSENFGLQNVISVYDKNGNFVKEKLHAYTGVDLNGYFMSFGNCAIINEKLYATVYNINSGASQLVSRILEYSLPDLILLNEADIGGNVAESITLKDGAYYVCYNDIQQIKKFDLNYNFLSAYTIPISANADGGYNGMIWVDNYAYLNMHGPNYVGQDNTGSLDKFLFDGTSFTYIESYSPPTYGCGQGINYFDGKYYWIDRVSNRIVITNSVNAGKLKPLIGYLNTFDMYAPTLLNGWAVYDNVYNRGLRVYKDFMGIVHFEGLIKGGSVGSVICKLHESFFPQYTKSFPVVAIDGSYGCISIIGNISNGFTPGDVFYIAGSTTSVSCDGVSYLSYLSDTTINNGFHADDWESDWVSGSFSSITGELTADSTRIRTADYISIEPSSQYLISKVSAIHSFVMYVFDSDYNFIPEDGYLRWQTTNITYTPSVSAKYVKFGVKRNDGAAIEPSEITIVELQFAEL